MKIVIAAPILSLLIADIASAQSYCARWQNNLDPCDGIIAQPKCSQPLDTWTPDDHIRYRRWLYADTAQEACEKYVKKHWGYDYLPAQAGPPNAIDVAPCWKDEDGDGMITNIDKVPGMTVHLNTQVQRDSCCDRVPNGPYSTLGQAALTPDHTFTSTQKSYIRRANVADHGNLWSDLTTAFGDYYNQLGHVDVVWNRDDDDDKIPLIYAPSAANVDHIIPRKDSNGCLCGTNSYANALMISFKLNNEMSNNCLHPMREYILQQFTLPAPNP